MWCVALFDNLCLPVENAVGFLQIFDLENKFT